MSGEVYDDGPAHTIEWDEDLETVILTWDDFVSGPTFREPLDVLLEALAEYETNKYLADTRALTAHDEADKDYLADTWVPRALEQGVDTAAVVPSESVIAEMNASEINQDINSSDDGFTHQVFDNMADARSWVKKQ